MSLVISIKFGKESDVQKNEAPRKKSGKSIGVITAVIAAIVLLVAGCTSDGDGDGQTKESKTQQSNYDSVSAKQPAHTMPYSPTRDTINFWIDTWKQPNKLSYVYLQNANGDLLGYYVLKGLPVSYCTSLTPNYKIYKDGGDGGGGNLQLPAPSIDSVYYSGGECNTYYGKDATSGAYIEYTVGLGINVLLYDQPLSNHPNVPNLAPPKK